MGRGAGGELVPRVCTVCSSEQRDEIEDAVLAGTPKRRIASQYGVSERAVRDHTKNHLPELLAIARDAQRAARADTLLDRLEALQERTEAILEQAEESGNFQDRFRGVAEMRRTLEIIGEVTKELNRSTTINLELSPEWGMIRAAIVEALEPAPPQIRGSVTMRLLQIEGGVLPYGDS
jgi:hypothetical protein